MDRHLLSAVIHSYLPRVFGFLTTPIIFIVTTKGLNPHDYGAFLHIVNIAAIAAFAFPLGLQKFLAFTIPGADTEHRHRALLSILATEVCLHIGLVLIILWPLAPFIADAINFPLHSAWLWVVPLLWTVQILEHRLLLFFGLIKRIELKVWLSILEKGIYAGGLLFVGWYGVSIGSIIIAQLAAFFLIAFIAASFLDLRALGKTRPSGSIIKESVYYCLPLILVDGSIKIIQSSDRFMISGFTNVEDSGLYGYAASYMNQAYYLASPVLWGIYPFWAELYKRKAKGETRRLFMLQLKVTLPIASFAALGLLVHKDFLVPFVSQKEYLEAGTTFSVWALIPFVLLFLYIYQQILLLERDTKFIGLAYLFAALLNIGLNALLIPAYGGFGAGVASAASFGWMAIRFWVRSKLFVNYMEHGWLALLIFGSALWFLVQTLIVVYLDRAPVVALVVCTILAFPMMHMMKLLDFKELWQLYKQKETVS